MTPCGQLGSKICVSEVEGKFLGEFSDHAKARKAICDKMKEDQFYTTTWWLSDHGNLDVRKLRCRH